MHYKPRFLLVAVVVSITGLLAALSIAHAANLLNNGGFNGAFVPQPGINGNVPAGWTAYNQFGNPLWRDSASACNCGGSNEKTEGTNAVQIDSEKQEKCCPPGLPFTAVLSQSVSGVQIGTAYSFAAAMLTFCGGSADLGGCTSRGYYMGKLVGIDPTGGTSPTAPSVIWSPENDDEHHWNDMTVAARATSANVTLFIKVIWAHQYHGAYTFWDAAYLSQAPTATLRSNALLSTGPITLTWSGRMPQDVSGDYNLIQLIYDVQVLDPGSAVWRNIMTDTQQTSNVFNGLAGSTYQFRVLPFMGYLADNGIDPANHRFDGLYTDPISVTVGDFTPPSSSVAPLAPIQYAPTFTVAWSGTDNITPPNALVYDIQVRDGAAGAWTPWLTTTALTSAQFSGLPGHTYSFRSRAHDAAANVEAYPASPDASTSVALAISGEIMNVREEPVAFAAASLNPSGLPAGPAGPDGAYTLWVTASNTYALTAAHGGFGALPPVGSIAANGANLTGLNVVLPPPVDFVANGQFENGNLGGWTGSIAAAPVVTSTAHSGGFAAALGGMPGVATTLQQTLFVSPTLSAPTLSYLYRAPVSAADLFTVTVLGDSLATVTNPVIPADDWTHQWLDLSPYAGQTITLTFAFRPSAAPERMLLDEVAVGEAGTAPLYRVYLPAIIR